MMLKRQQALVEVVRRRVVGSVWHKRYPVVLTGIIPFSDGGVSGEGGTIFKKLTFAVNINGIGAFLCIAVQNAND